MLYGFLLINFLFWQIVWKINEVTYVSDILLQQLVCSVTLVVLFLDRVTHLAQTPLSHEEKDLVTIECFIIRH